jgi:hypothetical protein
MNALTESLLTYSKSHFETAKLLLPLVDPMPNILYVICPLLYLKYVKLILDDCRIHIKADTVYDRIEIVKNSRQMDISIDLTNDVSEASVWTPTISSKKEIIQLLGDYNANGRCDSEAERLAV